MSIFITPHHGHKLRCYITAGMSNAVHGDGGINLSVINNPQSVAAPVVSLEPYSHAGSQPFQGPAVGLIAYMRSFSLTPIPGRSIHWIRFDGPHQHTYKQATRFTKYYQSINAHIHEITLQNCNRYFDSIYPGCIHPLGLTPEGMRELTSVRRMSVRSPLHASCGLSLPFNTF